MNVFLWVKYNDHGPPHHLPVIVRVQGWCYERRDDTPLHIQDVLGFLLLRVERHVSHPLHHKAQRIPREEGREGCCKMLYSAICTRKKFLRHLQLR